MYATKEFPEICIAEQLGLPFFIQNIFLKKILVEIDQKAGRTTLIHQQGLVLFGVGIVFFKGEDLIR